MNASRKRLTSWIAMFAILLGALAPAISQAMVRYASAQGAGWDVICTALGMVPVALDADAGAADDAGKMPVGMDSMQACAYCSVHAGSHGLVPPRAVQAPRILADFVLLAADSHAPPWRPDFGFAESRAPPIA